MNTVGFKKLDRKPIRAKQLSAKQFKERGENGLASLFDIESDIGGFRFLHAINRFMQTSYLILHFPDFTDKPTVYEMSLQDYHMYVSYWIINLQVENGGLKMPEGKPTPLENLRWCMNEMVKNSR
jgi:hypothetical protein